MTDEELIAIEARANAASSHWAEFGDVSDSADDVPALVAEVRRLRGLVEAAYEEAYSNGFDPYSDQHWLTSDARREMLNASSGSSDQRALDGAP
jgi:hypothetical protein